MMNYDLSPMLSRMTPFSGEGGALAAVDVNFGPIMIRAKLFKSQAGSYFLSWPSRKGTSTEKWYDQAAISDNKLKDRALQLTLEAYQKLSEGVLVAV